MFDLVFFLLMPDGFKAKVESAHMIYGTSVMLTGTGLGPSVMHLLRSCMGEMIREIN